MRDGRIEEILEVLLPPPDNVPTHGQQPPSLTVNSVGEALLPPPEAPDGLPESLRGQTVVLLHGLTELLPGPNFCLCHSESGIWSKLFRRWELKYPCPRAPPDVPSRPSLYTWACQICPAVSSSSTSNSPPDGDQWTVQPLSSPDPKAQGCDPHIHRGKSQQEMAELEGNKQTQHSSPPLPTGHSRLEKSPITLEELGTIAHAVHGGEPDYLYSISLDLLHKLRLLPPQRGDISRP
ncbi:hypothetical protein ILYODFUR_012909 [Ilyodon furcidens]|uniref:Uncharacterized protein n=1 Tax=Ilyodon furcidens TaxID=33524 RepID=A0ABV0SY78_9TELE